MAETIRPYDFADYLDSNEKIALYLEEAFTEDDPAAICRALGVVTRARGMTEIARRTGLSRESLYKALSSDGNPEFATVMKVMQALGFRLSPTAADAAE